MRPTLALLLAVPLLLSCPSTETAAFPPGPEDPAANLAQLDAFADRVQTEAMTAAWRGATEPRPTPDPKPFGIRPLLHLTDDEVRGLNGRLDGLRQSQCLQAVHSLAVRMQSESDYHVKKALVSIAEVRERNPDLGRTVNAEQWFSQAPVANELAPRLLQLVSARNRWARQRSRSPYLELMKKHRGYAPETAEGLERQVKQALSRDVPSNPPWEFESMEPALSAQLATRFDEAGCLRRASSVLPYLGLPPNPPALQVRDATRTAFAASAFYAIDPPALQGLTVRRGAGAVPHASAFHEFGHAAMSLLVKPESCRTFRRPISPAVSEGCARIAERLFYSEEWLRSQGVPPDEIAALRKWERRSELMRVRSILADLELERVLYQNPDGDVMNQYVDIQRRTAGVQMGGEFPAWALKRDLVFEPLARMDYLLARCAQAAVYRRLRQLPGGLLGEAARRHLREQVFAGATALRFEEWYRRAVGTEPDCAAWLEDVAR
jgi:hypothetical protein